MLIALYSQTQSNVPEYLKENNFDALFSMENSFHPLSFGDILVNYRLLWIFVQFFYNHRKFNTKMGMEEEKEEKFSVKYTNFHYIVTRNFANQLEVIEMWEYSILVILLTPCGN